MTRIRRALGYVLREAASDLWARRKINLVSVFTIGATLYIAGLFLFLMANLGHLVSSWAQENRVSVYLSDSVSEPERTRLAMDLAGFPGVARAEFVSKDDALRRFRTDFPDLADLAVGLDANPLPASYEIVLREGAADPEAVEALAVKLRAHAGVDGVRYDLIWVRRVRTLLTALAWGGAALGAVLFVAAVITISGVIRLNVHARRDEIEILRLVGATRTFIRGPFLVEGIFQGVASSAFAVVLVGATWLVLSRTAWVRQDSLLSVLTGAFLPMWAPAALIAVGLAAGLIGSLLSVRKVFAAS
jgi:cell division transport system permease protein